MPVGEHQPKRSSWVNHPAARMWRGHEFKLIEYAVEVCHEWIRRGYNDTLLPQFKDAWWKIAWNSDRLISSPNWLGYDAFHASHRSNLLRKDRAWYGQFGWQEPADLEYMWPVEKEVAA